MGVSIKKMHYLRFYIKIIFFFFTFATKYDLYKMNKIR